MHSAGKYLTVSVFVFFFLFDVELKENLGPIFVVVQSTKLIWSVLARIVISVFKFSELQFKNTVVVERHSNKIGLKVVVTDLKNLDRRFG